MSAWWLPLACAASVLVVGVAAAAAARSSLAGTAAARLQNPGPAGAPAWFPEVLAALDVPVDPEVAWPWVPRASAVVGLVLVARAPVVLVVVALGGCVGVVAHRSRGRRARSGDLERELPVLLDDVVAAMASGSSLAQGLAGAAGRPGPLAAELREVLRLTSGGSPLQHALDSWADRHPGSGLGLVADALALAGATGGSQVAALRSVGATLAEHRARQREVRALAAQAQLSAVVLVVTPLAFAGVVAVLDHRIAAFLVTSPAGWACLVGGVALDGAGAWWMRRLVRGVS
ncbi:MAG: type II secretion system F family protein [Acidimicrobiales bacterium]